MTIDQIIRAWKSEEDALDANIPENPVGNELSEEELEQVVGGLCTGCSILSCKLNFRENTGC